MRRLYSSPNAKYHGLRTQNVRSVATLNRNADALQQYIDERKASAARARRREEAEDKSRREQMLEVVHANPHVVRLPDKRKTAFTKSGKKIKTRTRRVAQQLRITRSKRRRKIK